MIGGYAEGHDTIFLLAQNLTIQWIDLPTKKIILYLSCKILFKSHFI